MYRRVIPVFIDNSETSCTTPQEEAHLSELLGCMRVDPCCKKTVIATVIQENDWPPEWRVRPRIEGQEYPYKIVLHRQEAVPQDFCAGKPPCQWLALLNVESGRTAHFFPDLDACIRAVQNVC